MFTWIKNKVTKAWQWTKEKTWKVFLLITGTGVALAVGTGVVTNQDTTLQAYALSHEASIETAIGDKTPVPYTVTAASDSSKVQPIKFQTATHYLSFTPTKLSLDTGESVSLANKASRQSINDVSDIDSHETTQTNGVIYTSVYGDFVDVGLLTYEDVFKKIVRVNNGDFLASVPANSKYAQVEFEINTDYDIPEGLIEGGISLEESVVLKQPKAWDSAGNSISIDAEIVKQGAHTYLVKKVPISWLKTATYPVYTDADVTVDAAVYISLYGQDGPTGPYWLDPDNATVFYVDNLNDISYATTSDGGATWSKTVIENGTVRHQSSWFDQETPGDTGNVVALTWVDSTTDEWYFITFDINTGTLGTKRTIASYSTISTSAFQNKTSITKTKSGNYIACLFTNGAQIDCKRSTNNFITGNSDIADVFEGTAAADRDLLLLFSANTADDDDAAAAYWDNSANAISVKMYDNSANTWTETAISGTFVTGLVNPEWGGAVRHSDGHILLGVHSDSGTATDDIKTFDINPSTISSVSVTAKTDVISNTDISENAAFVINQQNDDIYVLYGYGTSFTNNIDLYYKKSTDGMATWGTETAYSETTGGNRRAHGGRTIGDNGGKVQWAWDEIGGDDLLVNTNNDINIAAAGAGGGAAPVVAPLLIEF